MKIQAKNDYVFIRLEKAQSSIITIKTEQYTEKDAWLRSTPAIVVSVGPDVKDIKEGDRIVIGATKAARYDYLTEVLGDTNKENVTYLACKECDIAGVIN